mgnify:CR=1 FL=1
MVVVALFLLWWTGLWKVDVGDLTVKGTVALQPSAIWQTLFWPILAWAAVQLVSALVTLVQPGRVRLRAAFELVLAAGGMALTTADTYHTPLGDIPLVGFFASGEIARHHLYGYTGVLTVFGG